MNLINLLLLKEKQYSLNELENELQNGLVIKFGGLIAIFFGIIAVNILNFSVNTLLLSLAIFIGYGIYFLYNYAILVSGKYIVIYGTIKRITEPYAKVGSNRNPLMEFYGPRTIEFVTDNGIKFKAYVKSASGYEPEHEFKIFVKDNFFDYAINNNDEYEIHDYIAVGKK